LRPLPGLFLDLEQNGFHRRAVFCYYTIERELSELIDFPQSVNDR